MQACGSAAACRVHHSRHSLDVTPPVFAPLQDKAIKRFSVRNLVDSGAMNDLKAACAIDGACAKAAGVKTSPHTPTPPPAAAYEPPKLYSKNYYCVSCAVHSRIVRVRNAQARRVREPPVRMRRPRRD